MEFLALLKLRCCLDNKVVMVGCYSLTAAASNPEMVDMLPHVRGQGVMDLEFESDGGCGTLACLLPLLTTPLPVFPLILSSFLPISFSLPLLCAEPVSTPPAHRHEVTYVTTHKGPSPAAIFSRDGTSGCQRFLNLQENVLVDFPLLWLTCCYHFC